jgi:hypothetical protein
MQFKKENFKTTAILTIPVLLIQVLLTKFVYPVFGATTQNAFSITPSTALTSQVLGDKLLGIISGIVTFDLGNLTSWISMGIGAFLLILAGLFVYEQKWSFKGKNETQRIFAILAYGTIILGVVLALTKLSVISAIGLPLLVGLGINYFAIASIVAFLASKTKLVRI